MPPKIHVIGIGDDGLEAMPTTRAPNHRRCRGAARHRADARPRAQVEGRAARRSRATSTSSSPRSRRPADKRVVLLIYGDPMFYGLARYVCEQARQGPVRRRAARVEHAARVCPRDGDVGRSVPHRPGQAPARRGAGKNPHGPKSRPVHDRPLRPGRGGQGAARPAHRLLHRLRLREPRRPRRTRHPRHARRDRRRRSSTRST